MEIKVKTIHQLNDNYSYIINSRYKKNAIVVDPAESKPIIEFLIKNNLSLECILITHHHSDHTSGIKKLLDFKNVDVYSPDLLIDGTTKLVKNNNTIDFGYINFTTITTPGHTLDHVIYYSDKEKILFSGDTLFAYGCGRIFEGTMQQMLDSLKKINQLPDNTKVYCGHEYTYKNLEFMFEELVSWKDTNALKENCKKTIKKNGSSMPFDLGHQKDWNPFLNYNNNHYIEEVSNFHKNKGKISSKASVLEFFTFIRNKRNIF